MTGTRTGVRVRGLLATVVWTLLATLGVTAPTAPAPAALAAGPPAAAPAHHLHADAYDDHDTARAASAATRHAAQRDDPTPPRPAPAAGTADPVVAPPVPARWASPGAEHPVPQRPHHARDRGRAPPAPSGT
ncbi:hypothetical protein ACF1AO_19190 [Streptomyces longwoodensis]|uniref:hypothetical protein n=1 Tax=Streptomyces longwoodensis TaxID=68231 RepID=UPI003701F5B6